MKEHVFYTYYSRNELQKRVDRFPHTQRGRAFVVRGNQCHTENDFFLEISAALQFPFKFQWNWDSLVENLSDLGWIYRQKIMIIVNNRDELFAEEQVEKRIQLMDCFLKSLKTACRVLEHKGKSAVILLNKEEKDLYKKSQTI